MDFGALPPEVNSGRMYSGPGSAPMLVAAAAWDRLAAELDAAAASCGSVVSGLTGGPWLGPASMSMAAAAAKYVAWLAATAAQCQRTAGQAKAAAAAYEAAYAMTVPPPVITANRTLLMTLIATNILGQNTPAIAATEVHYAEMWAQDAAAMYGYAAASATAAILPPFSPPAPTTNPAGLPGQAAAIAQAVTMSTRSDTQTILALLLAAVPETLRSLASLTLSPASIVSTVLSWSSLASMSSSTSTVSASTHTPTSMADGNSGAVQTSALPLERETGSQTSTLNSAAPGGAAVSTVRGRAVSVGAVSAPPSWAAVAPAFRPGAAVLPGAGVNRSTALPKNGSGGLIGVLPTAGMPTRATGAPAPRVGIRLSVVPRPPSGG